MTLPSDQLPLDPQVTPGWGVAGTILLLTGLTYSLIGMKNRWIHTFFSAAYLAALGITVLIIYVMQVPVSDALQGGYVVAVVVSSCAVGAASTFFRELTEGFGCALGGFCVSMWLMCLSPGGLLQQATARAIFIAAFTLGGFAFYFSHFTRDWALIILISFGGATVAVLGIDCFSKAGLKEFWAYTWHLNDNLFPFGAETYPVTKGIRVEIAAVVIIFLFGVISQIKLWRIIRDRRGKREAERAEDQRNLQQEEENVGRQIEARMRRDREAWERIYGDDTVISFRDSRMSEPGQFDLEKAGYRSSYMSRHHSNQVIELENLSESNESQQHIISSAASHGEKGPVIVQSVHGDHFTGSMDESGLHEELHDGEADIQQRRSSIQSKRTSRNSTHTKRHSRSVSLTQAPEVVPLPFTVPEGDESNAGSDRSSVAAFIEEDNNQPTSKGRTIAKRLSKSSATLLRSLSQRSAKTSEIADKTCESQEDLVLPRDEDDNGSLAATLDHESIASSRRSSVAVESRKSIEITADLNSAENAAGSTVSHQPHPATSVASALSVPASLRNGHLPPSLSRVALSYRTNEWAKHLSHADAPDVDELPTAEALSTAGDDTARPVDMEGLQQVAEHGIPPAIRRSESRAAHVSAALDNLTGADDKRLTTGNVVLPPSTPTESMRSPKSPSNSFMRSPSNFGLRKASPIAPIAEENGSGEVPSDDAASRAQQQPISRPAIPGIVSFDTPQTLIGQRDLFVRSRSQANLAHAPSAMTNHGGSDAGSIADYPMYPPGAVLDGDDLTLTQRRQFMRNNSRISLTPSVTSFHNTDGYHGGAEPVAFDSHQPQRNSNLPSPAAREAKLANFRMSVSQDLRAGNPVMLSSTRDTPFASTNSLLNSRDHELQRNIEFQRNIMLGQKEVEAQRREMQKRDREFSDRAFNERMRTGDLQEAHREAMKKMQKGSK